METILNHLIQATGWSILHSLWQAALIYALLLPFQTKVFKISAKLRYSLAYAANCLTFLCFVYTFFSIFRWPSGADSVQTFGGQVLVLPLSLPQVMIHYVETAFPYLVLLYSIGLIIQSYIVIKGYQKVQSLKNTDYTSIPAEWEVLFERLKAGLGLQKPMEFRLSGYVNVPLVIGFFKPVILFPIALAAQMETAQVEAILIHELSHIRRNDYIFNLIRTMIDTVLFFNPFVRMTGKLIDIEREHACDDLVVKITEKPLTYAHALLNLEILTDKSSPLFALAATGTNQHLYQRIKRITDMKTNYSNPKQKIFAISLTIATIVSLAWINPAKSDKQHTSAKAQTSNDGVVLTAVSLQDTTKKKVPQQIKFVKITAANSVRPPKPPAAPRPPRAIPEPAAPEAPEAPEAPDMPQVNMNIDEIITPAVSKAIADFSINVKDLVLANLNVKDESQKTVSWMDSKKQQVEMQKMAAKMQQNALVMQKKFDSPEQRAKFEKYAKEMQAKYNNPAQVAKYEKMAKEAGEQAQRTINSPGFKNKMRELQASNNAHVIFLESEDKQKIRQTPEYIELKNKFDKDVEELAKKKLKNENN